MRPSRPLAYLSVIVASSLLVTGCSSGGGPGESDRVSINSILGMDDQEWNEDTARAQEEQIQELVAECMIQEGWEYIPVQQPDFFYEYSPEDEKERIEREGFGIVYWTLNQGNDEMFDDPYAEFVDPNTDYVESLSDAEREAYYESLWGTQEEQEAETVIEIDPVTGEEYHVQYGHGPGCQGEAYEEVYGGDLYQDEDFQQAMQVFYEELWERVQADPRMIELNDNWVACMKDAGLEFEDREEFWEKGWNSIQTRHDEIVGTDLWADPMEGWSEDEINDFFENSTQDEIDALFNWSIDLTDEQRSALEALLADEIAMALADFECSEDFYEKEADIYSEVEALYAEEHRAELEQLAASLGADA